MYGKYEELLKKTGETSYQVSKATGVGQNTLSNWKTGRSQPKIGKLQKIADHFGVPVTYFLEDTTTIADALGVEMNELFKKGGK